jgi:hypothetical protein
LATGDVTTNSGCLTTAGDFIGRQPEVVAAGDSVKTQQFFHVVTGGKERKRREERKEKKRRKGGKEERKGGNISI